MRYRKGHPNERNFPGPATLLPGIGAGVNDPREAAGWSKFLRENRAALEANWRALAPLHAWWLELNTFDRIGDLTPARPDADIMAFAPVRHYSQHAAAIASLRAIDGRGDEAMAIVLPLLEVSRKLEPSSRTLVRFMIARVIQRIALQTATFVLDTTEVSTAHRAQLLAATSGGSGGEPGARRLVSIDYAGTLGGMKDMPLGDALALFQLVGPKIKLLPQRLLNALSPIAYNPRRTFNVLGDYVDQVQNLAARRDIGQLGAADQTLTRDVNRPRFKNVAGSFLGTMIQPTYVKVVESYWKTEDQRAALRHRLAPP
jgi:hypothetical protein